MIAMYSVYERLMNLPLFKGAGEDLINEFAEKTPLEFKTFAPGEVIISENQICNEVVCLLSGRVKRVMKYCSGRLIVSELIKGGTLIGIEHLFGLHQKYNMEITASEEAGIMYFPKQHYLRLLQSSNLILINCLNYLSRFAQNGRNALKSHDMSGIDSVISYLLQVTTAANATEIYLTTPFSSFIEFIAPYSNRGESEFEDMINRGLVKLVNPQTLYVPSRDAVLEEYKLEL